MFSPTDSQMGSHMNDRNFRMDGSFRLVRLDRYKAGSLQWNLPWEPGLERQISRERPLWSNPKITEFFSEFIYDYVLMDDEGNFWRVEEDKPIELPDEENDWIVGFSPKGSNIGDFRLEHYDPDYEGASDLVLNEETNESWQVIPDKVPKMYFPRGY